MTIIERGRLMDITDAIIRYRRFLKRINISPNTVKNYFERPETFCDLAGCADSRKPHTGRLWRIWIISSANG